MKAECDRLRASGTVEELLAALSDLRSYDANEGDPYGGSWPISVGETAAELLAERGAEVVPALLERAREHFLAARALARSTADLGPWADALLELYLHGPTLVSQELGHRLCKMDLSDHLLARPLTARALKLLRLEDGPGLERALEQVPSLVLVPELAEAALDALYVKPLQPYLQASREGLVALLKGPLAERAAEVLGYLRDGAPELADLALGTASSRLAGVALKALARSSPDRLDPLLDRLMGLKDPDRLGRLMPVLKQAARPRTRGFIEGFLASVPADSWQAASAREALAALPA